MQDPFWILREQAYRQPPWHLLWVEQMIEENISITDLVQWVLSEVPLKMAQMGNLRGRAWLLETSNLKQIDDRKENEIGQGLNPMSGILLLQVNFTSNN